MTGPQSLPRDESHLQQMALDEPLKSTRGERVDRRFLFSAEFGRVLGRHGPLAVIDGPGRPLQASALAIRFDSWRGWSGVVGETFFQPAVVFLL